MRFRISRLIAALFLAFIFVAMLFFIGVVLVGCDFRENALIREQSETFTEEIREKNKDMQSLANQLEIVIEKNKKLELMLMCRDEVTDKAVEEGKKNLLKTFPVKIPQKSNKVQEERENQ